MNWTKAENVGVCWILIKEEDVSTSSARLPSTILCWVHLAGEKTTCHRNLKVFCALDSFANYLSDALFPTFQPPVIECTLFSIVFHTKQATYQQRLQTEDIPEIVNLKKMKSKPQCSTKLCKLQILWNKSTHHERPMYVEVSTNLIKCILNGAVFCCSSFIERENAQRLLKTRGRPLVDGCNWGDGLKKANTQKLKDFHIFEFCTDRIRSKLWTRWHPVLPLTHICVCYMEKRKLETWKSQSPCS